MPYCDPCDRAFRDQQAYIQHLTHSVQHDYCSRCNRDFGSYNALTSHLANSSSHNHCKFCSLDFYHRSTLDDHYEELHPRCEICYHRAKNEIGLHEHRRQAHSDRYCSSCRRVFQNSNNLDNHLDSAIHKPKIFKCPDVRCGTSYVSVSAVILHLEGGRCPSGINRALIDRYIATHDTRRLISKRPLLLTNGTSTLTATDQSWNGRGYECPLCQAVCPTIPQLNHHLASSKHANGGQKIYHCPQCQRDFPSLSALGSHVERGGCGMRENAALKAAMDGLTSRFAGLTYY